MPRYLHTIQKHVSLFTPEDWERLQDLVKEALQTGAPYEPGIEIVSREPKAK